MRRCWQKGSFTVEAAIWVPIMVFLIMGVIRIGIYFFEKCMTRESYAGLRQLDIVQEFYNYQILEELKEEIQDD